MADEEKIPREESSNAGAKQVNEALYKLLFYGLYYLHRKFPNNRVVEGLSSWVEEFLFVTFRSARRTRKIFGIPESGKIYIIFAPQDTGHAIEISLYLEIHGYETFSQHKYRKNASISVAAEEYFRHSSERCSIFVAIISSAFFQSGYCRAELEAAKKSVHDRSAKLVYFLVEEIAPQQDGIDAECVKLLGLSREERKAAVLSAIRAKDKLPAPIENISAPFSFGWKASRKIGLIAGPENTPTFPFARSDEDHQQRINALRESVLRVVDDLKGHSHNVRSAYSITLERYLSDLPSGPGSGNFLLADCEARTLRGMFEEDAAVLNRDFAERLNRILELHMALRPFYDGVERFYSDVRRGTLSQPLPLDAINDFVREVRKYTPDIFEPDVSAAFDEIRHQELSRSALATNHSDAQAPRETQAIVVPRADPIEAPDPEKMQSYGQASTVNNLYSAVLKGKDISAAVKGWDDLAHTLSQYASPVIDWLKNYLAQ